MKAPEYTIHGGMLEQTETARGNFYSVNLCKLMIIGQEMWRSLWKVCVCLWGMEKERVAVGKEWINIAISLLKFSVKIKTIILLLSLELSEAICQDV